MCVISSNNMYRYQQLLEAPEIARFYLDMNVPDVSDRKTVETFCFFPPLRLRDNCQTRKRRKWMGMGDFVKERVNCLETG